MKLSFILIFILEIFPFTYGQSVVPLSIGNKWIYTVNGNSKNVESYEVVSDTIISGQKFSKLKHTSSAKVDYDYWRADSNQFYIKSHYLFASGIKYDEDSTKWKAEGIESSYMDFLIYKNRRVQKAYTEHYISQHFWNYKFVTAPYFGPVEIDFSYSDDVSGYSSLSISSIKGAVINGDVYGDTTITPPPPPPPPKPAAPKLTAIAGNNLIELQWSKFRRNDFQEYNLYETINSVDSLIYTTKDINDTTLMIKGLTNGIVYYFKINAVNSHGISSDFSNVAKAPALYTKALDMKGDFTPDFDNTGFNGIMNQQGSNYALYKNEAGTFVKTNSFPALSSVSISWVDYNNDGYYDIFFSGANSNDNAVSKIYRNQSGSFTDINANITGVVAGSIDWADYDNDGDLDFIITGDPTDPYFVVERDPKLPTTRITKLYRNDGNGVFTLVKSDFPGIIWGSAVWGDYNNDGSEDLLLCGLDFIKIYKNTNGNFKQTFNFKGYNNTGTWGDFNNDGFLDFCVISADTFSVTQNNAMLKVFKNNGDNTFTEYTFASSLLYTPINTRDYNNDGNLDIVLPYLNKIYQNNGNFNFKRMSPPGSESLADYDNDGDLDITDHYGSGIYRNNLIFNQTFNTKKKLNPPINLSAKILPDHSVKFSWNTPELGDTSQVLSYNLRIGTKSNGVDILSPMSNLVTGKRLKLAIGNAGFATFKIMNNLPDSNYYWSVQSVDNNYNASGFAQEKEIKIDYEAVDIPDKFFLKQNFPNPFNAQTTIQYDLPVDQFVTVKIYDITGSEVKTLINKYQKAGRYNIKFNSGSLASGVYFCRIFTEVYSKVNKMIILK